MKLLRYGPAGKEKPGLLDDNGNIRDLSKVIDDITPDVLSPRGLAAIRKRDPKRLPLVKGRPRIGSPVVERRVFAIGLNYAKHAAEAGMKIPSEPILFTKTCPLTGPNDRIVLPKGAKKGDWEVELCVIMGSMASFVSEDVALDHVAGYAVGNDVSEREFQQERPAGQWTKGKSGDGWAPVGPWLVTKDEVPNPEKLSIWLEVNGKKVQNGSTDKLIFNIKQIVSFVSEYMTLLPGDIIMTGTPPGVGAGMDPQQWLNVGDTMRLGIEGLGEQSQSVVGR